MKKKVKKKGKLGYKREKDEKGAFFEIRKKGKRGSKKKRLNEGDQ